jgi:hypothetical protein
VLSTFHVALPEELVPSAERAAADKILGTTVIGIGGDQGRVVWAAPTISGGGLAVQVEFDDGPTARLLIDGVLKGVSIG